MQTEETFPKNATLLWNNGGSH